MFQSPKSHRILACIAVVALGGSIGCAGKGPAPKAAPEDPLAEPLPVDSDVTIGTLPNGLTYYVEHNTKPEQRAELRLVVKAGSILEDKDQLGLAHVVEHMAFNGTELFTGNQLVEYLESVGIKFGAHLNAYTSFDETVYMLQVPTDQPELLDRGLVVLQQWASAITFDPDEVEKERGVVLEEWRRTLGAGGRLRDKILPLTFHESLYKDRLPIGTEESLKNFSREALVRYYEDWYRPNLMAVIAVGDFDVPAVEKKIVETFSKLEPSRTPRERVHPPIPNHEETLYGIFSDPEVPGTSVTLLSKFDDREGNTHRSYRDMFIERIASTILNERFAEISREPDAPFLGAGGGKQRLSPTEAAHTVGAAVKEGKVLDALGVLYTEIRRARELGFTKAELDRAVRQMMRGMENFFTERKTTHSRTHAAELIRVFTTGEAMPGITYEYELAKRYLPEITVAELNAYAANWMTPKGQVVTVVMPEKEGLELPTKETLATVEKDVAALVLEAKAEDAVDRPLMTELPSPGTITQRETVKELGVTKWTLSNGVTVLLKPTEFKADQIIMDAYSWGGTAQVDEKELVSAQSALAISNLSGLGDFDALELQKILAGRSVAASLYTNEQMDGVSGSSGKEDLERLFQITHMLFTQRRLNERGLDLYRASRTEALRNRLSDPGATFRDTFSKLMWQDFPRYRPWTIETLEQLDLDGSKKFLDERFGNAGDFVFAFVGSFELDTLEPFVTRYLASLPADSSKTDAPKDVGARRNPSVATEVVQKGIDPQSSLLFSLHGDFESNRDNRFLLSAMAEVLSVRLREELREELGGTYSVGAYASFREVPVSDYSISIRFSADPERVFVLATRMMEVVEELRKAPPKKRYVDQIKAQLLRQRETSEKDNGFWAGALLSYHRRGEDLKLIQEYTKLVNSLSVERVHEAAKQWLGLEQYIQVTLMPKSDVKSHIEPSSE